MKDRIKLLKELMAKNGCPVPYNFGNSNSPTIFMADFFTKVSKIRTVLKRIENYYKEIVRLHNSILSSVDQNSDDKDNLEKLMELVKDDTNCIRCFLKEIEKEINSSPDLNSQNPHVEFRIMQTQHQTLLLMFHNLVSQYNLTQVEYRSRCKDRIKRQLSIANQSIDDNELENMLEQERVAIFTQEIVTETEQAKQSLADVEARHQDIVRLERSIRDLHDMFLDMAILIESQGEMVNRIDFNVSIAQDSVEKAVMDTHKAVQYQSSVRKKRLLIIIIVVTLVTVLTAAIIGGIFGK